MAYRKRMSRSQNRRNFSRGNRIHPKNLRMKSPMRGGIRL